MEAGTALGGSAITLASAKRKERALMVFDAFGLIPPPSDKDGADVHDRYRTIVSGASKGIGDDRYYGYREDLLGEVTGSFRSFGLEPSEHNIAFVKGFYQDTLRLEQPVALAHLDCDWYESLRTCLERIEPHLAPGGRQIDDYYNWSGCTTAVDEFFATRRDRYGFEHRSRLHIVKRA